MDKALTQNSRVRLPAILTAYAYFAAGSFLWKMCRLILMNYRSRRATAHYARPKTHPIFGMVPERNKNKDRRWEWFNELFERKKVKTAVFPLSIFAKTTMVVTEDPVVVQHILKDHFDNYIKPQQGEFPIGLFSDLMGGGIFTISHGPHSLDKGKSWYSQRKLSSQIFTQANFRDYFVGVFCANGHILSERLSKVKGPVDLQELFFRYTMDSFGEIGFGCEFGTLSGKEAEFAEAFDKAHSILVPFNNSGFLKILMVYEFLPFPFNKLFIEYKKRFEPALVSFYHELGRINRSAYKMIDDRLKDPGIEEKQDLLSLFAVAERDAAANAGRAMSKKFLRDILLNFIIAGRDTTACTLSWTFYRLALHTEVCDKLVKEIDTVLGADEPTFASLRGMKYLHGVIYESLRLHPPVPFDTKIAASADVLPDGTKIPKGTRVAFFVWGMGHSSQLWENPEEFKPERWMEQEEPKSAYQFPVFQAGQRICLGKDMAILEAKLLTVMLLQRYRFTLVPGQNFTYSETLTMSIRDGLKVNVVPRA